MPLNHLLGQIRSDLYLPPIPVDGMPLPSDACFYGAPSPATVKYFTPLHPRRWGALNGLSKSGFSGRGVWSYLEKFGSTTDGRVGLKDLDAALKAARIPNASDLTSMAALYELLACRKPTAKYTDLARLAQLSCTTRSNTPLAVPSTKFVKKVWWGWYWVMGHLLQYHGLNWSDVQVRHLPILLGPDKQKLKLANHSEVENIPMYLLQKWDETVRSWSHSGNFNAALSIDKDSFPKEINASAWCNSFISIAYATAHKNPSKEPWPTQWLRQTNDSEKVLSVPLRYFVSQRNTRKSTKPENDAVLAMFLAFAATKLLAEKFSSYQLTEQRNLAFKGLTMNDIHFIPSFEDSWRRAQHSLEKAGKRILNEKNFPTKVSGQVRFSGEILLLMLPLELSDQLIDDEGMLGLEISLGDLRAWRHGAAADLWMQADAAWPVFIEIFDENERCLGMWPGAANDSEDLPDHRHRIWVEWGDAVENSAASRVIQEITDVIAGEAFLFDVAEIEQPIIPNIYVRLTI